MPRLAPTLFEFVELDSGDYLKVTEACMRIFDRQDWLRANRARARIKVLIDKVGIDAFREMVKEELEGDWVSERDFSIDALLYEHDEEAGAPPAREFYASANGDRRELDRFIETNATAQRQPSFSTVEVKVPRGDLTPEQLRGLAQIMREHSGGYARTSVHQNLILRWVRDAALYEVWSGLCKLGLGENGAVEDPLTRRIHIKMSGCPNGCGQHHIANIGFYGASIKVGQHTIPAYIPHVGGAYEGGEVRYGQRLKARLPAKRVPEAVERWVRLYESQRLEGEQFNAFVDRVGSAEFEAHVKDLTMPIEFNIDNMNYFADWSRSGPFEVIRGEGECAV